MALVIKVVQISGSTMGLSGYHGGPSAQGRIDTFIAILAEYGIPATVRIRRGIDIDAGCGQLKSNVLKRQRRGVVPLETVAGSVEE